MEKIQQHHIKKSFILSFDTLKYQCYFLSQRHSIKPILFILLRQWKNWRCRKKKFFRISFLKLLNLLSPRFSISPLSPHYFSPSKQSLLKWSSIIFFYLSILFFCMWRLKLYFYFVFSIQNFFIEIYPIILFLFVICAVWCVFGL